ncbi:DUF1302 domain-containing protein [Marinobacterium arenosum]|uniref:DUF1302 domain-containing protein n=1 Tax=Marinobacterium arenosum TaxID=2862496 RepID=UPI002108388A|nr:DUF1302 domain-containing protein [Marinobacterium arenosum]
MSFNKLAAGVVVAIGMSQAATVSAAETQWAGFVENATYYREGRGISKFRNTAQAEFLKPLESSGAWTDVTLNGVLRATYDGVYDLNDDEFGKDATEPYLGSNWHPQGSATGGPFLSAGVPFPCDNDPTLCNNLDGYMDHDEDDARFPDFNDELDFLREFYIDATRNLDNGDQLSFRIGKQQVVWGRTDLFRVLDVINPVDYSRHSIYDELEDIRIPQWIAQAEWRMGPTGTFDDSNLAVVWNFDKFRPSNLGTCGQAYRILDAGCFFSSSMNLNLLPGAAFPGGANPYGSAVPIIHDVEDPDWALDNTQLGVKWEGVYGDLTFSLNALHYRQQLPSLHFRPLAPGLPIPATDGVFDIKFPRVNLVGGSIDYYSQAMDAVWRLETTYTHGEELPRDTDGHKETDMLRYVIGFDKNQLIPALNETRAFLISAQLFGQHILDYETDMPDFEDNWIGTLLVKGWWMSDRLSPQLIVAHDFRAGATAIAPSVEWLPTDNWKLTLGANFKTGGDETFDWSVNNGAGATPNDYEPLARFSNGPIGVANQEDEIQLTVRYSF